MQNIQIRNSIKKLVVKNLCRLFGDSILFVGSLCDAMYVELPIEEITDIDIKVPLSKRSIFLNELLTQEFHIYNQSGHRFIVRPYRTYEPIRNFGTHRTSYYGDNVKAFPFAYHLHILGVCVDITFYYDNDDIVLEKNQIDKNFYIQTIANRKKLLEEFSRKLNLHPRVQEKHLFKLTLYEYKINSTLIDPFNKIDDYTLPNEFDPIIYKQKNIHDLYRLTTKDSLIDHYIAHGIFENRII